MNLGAWVAVPVDILLQYMLVTKLLIRTITKLRIKKTEV